MLRARGGRVTGLIADVDAMESARAALDTDDARSSSSVEFGVQIRFVDDTVHEPSADTDVKKDADEADNKTDAKAVAQYDTKDEALRQRVLERVRGSCAGLEPAFSDDGARVVLPVPRLAAAAHAGELDDVMPPKVLAGHSTLRGLNRTLISAGASFAFDESTGSESRRSGCWRMNWPATVSLSEFLPRPLLSGDLPALSEGKRERTKGEAEARISAERSECSVSLFFSRKPVER